MAFTLPPLPYAYDALEPHIDEQTMRIHHDKHHATYVNNLNAALEAHPDLQKKSVEDLIGNLDALPEAVRTPVRNNDPVESFALRNLGFQVRYRYEFAPLSYLYLAYVRGGSMFETGAGPYSVGDEFSGAFDLRDSEQLLVKLSYRFEI